MASGGRVRVGGESVTTVVAAIAKNRVRVSTRSCASGIL
jgi:hypothetical protein